MDVRPLTVLLADGEPDMRLYLRSCLRGLTPPLARVVEAADGLDALHLTRSGGIDVVIAAAALPGLDGHRLRRAIRDDAALAPVVVLLLDADASAGERAADGVLAGPFNGRRLLGALAAAALTAQREPRIAGAPGHPVPVP